MLHCYDFLGLSILALVNCTELSFAELSSLDVLVVKVQVAGFLLEAFNPVKDGLVVSMKVCARAYRR